MGARFINAAIVMPHLSSIVYRSTIGSTAGEGGCSMLGDPH